MPPSPALRCSPGRELKAENHKRGLSLEGGLVLKEKDDDLALFNEMQTREKETFLLHSTDDLDDSFSTKLRYFSDFKLGISIPVRGESSDLLNADGDKNDYDWLLTPPDTPLFPSLDDETPQTNLSHRSRPRSQPISISRSGTTETSYRTNRSSTSPHRLSTSPRSGNGTFQSRGRASSAPHSSPNPILRPTTPARSPSTPPNKPSTSAPRSSTPTPRRMSTSSSGTVASSGRRGTSPAKTTCGNSTSPKLQAWQSTIPGFSSEAPPNLRTSLSDRPASYVRGSSPASRNGRGLSPSSNNGRGLSPSSRNGRGLSPASNNGRGLSPSSRNGRGLSPASNNGRGLSPASNNGRGLSPSSRNERGLSPVSSDGRGLSPASRNGRDSSSKFGRQSMSPTASRSASSSQSHDRDQFSSQSKGSVASSVDDDIDSLQSVSASISDHSTARKVGVFPSSRALAFSKKPSRILSPSSAPKRSFDSALRQMDRRNPQNMFRPLLSSVPSTTFYAGKTNSTHRPMISRNSSVTTSSNASSEQGASAAPDTESSDRDQDHMTTEWRKAPYPDTHDEVFIFDKVDEINEDVGHDIHSEKTNVVHGNFEGIPSEVVDPGESENFSGHNASKSICIEGELSEIVSHESLAICSRCGKKFNVTAPTLVNEDICPDCSEKGGYLPLPTAETTVVTQSTISQLEMTLEGNKSFEVHELLELTNKSKSMGVQDETNVEQCRSCLPESSVATSTVEKGEEKHAIFGSNQSESNTGAQHFHAHQNLKVDVSDGVGISVLLKRSSSSKWPVVQARAFTATDISFDDPSYARDGMNSMRNSIGYGTSSASSSIDFSSSRQTEACVQRQFSGKKSDMENSRHDLNIQTQSQGSLFSGFGKATSEENSDVSVGNLEHKALEEMVLVTEENGRDTKMGDTTSSFVRTAVVEQDKLHLIESCRMTDASTSELSTHTAFPNDDDCDSSGNTEEFPNNARNISDLEVPATTRESFLVEEDATLNSGVCEVDDPTHGSLHMVSEELENGRESTSCSQTDSATFPKSITDEFHEPPFPTISEKDTSVSASESSISDHENGILEESTVTVEGPRGQMSRSLTLEEATDTILFCNSIIHDLAYQAVTIGMEKENLVPLEGSRPRVAVLGKFGSDRKDPRGRIGSKRTPKSQKVKQRRVDTDVRSQSTKTETDIKTHGSLTHDSGVPNRVDSSRPLKLESKCNCTVM